MSIELTVLGCSGSFAAPASGPCSGYLVRSGATVVWIDCGAGTFERLPRHVVPEDVTAVVITHRHPDHCVDILGFEVYLRYYRQIPVGPPVFVPAGVVTGLQGLSTGVEKYFRWDEVGDGDERTIADVGLRFSHTDHSVPTLAVEVSSADKRLVYTSDTGPKWSAAAFAPRPDLLLCEATYQNESDGPPLHLTARAAGTMARDVGARRLIITHVSPALDPAASVAQAEEAFGQPVTLAAPDLRVRI